MKLNHSSIVECYDVIDNGKQMVLVMEYLRGGALLDDLHHIAGESYTEQQAAIIAAQVILCFALMYHLQCVDNKKTAHVAMHLDQQSFLPEICLHICGWLGAYG